MKAIGLVLAALFTCVPVAAQRDFLTADEADQLRLAQEPDLRIKLYLGFARLRMDLLDQLFSEQRTGRSSVIHDTLTQLSSIIETLDVVVDDALAHQKLIASLADVAKTERDILKRLEKHLAAEPPDLARYRFVLESAIDTVRDSTELAEEDLKSRTRNAEAKEGEIKKEREALMTPESKAEAKKAEEKKAADEAKDKKKPTLLRKGETLPAKKQN